jgi:hypothetical protein
VPWRSDKFPDSFIHLLPSHSTQRFDIDDKIFASNNLRNFSPSSIPGKTHRVEADKGKSLRDFF